MVKIVALTALWSVIILGIIKMAHLSSDYISWKEYVKIIIHGKTGYVINQYWFLKALIMIYLFYPLVKRTYDNDRASLFVFLLMVFLLTFGNKILYMAHQIFLICYGKPVVDEIKNYIPWYNYFYNVPHAYALVYFIAGGFIYKSMLDGFKHVHKIVLLTLFVLSWALSIAVSLLFETKMKWDPCFYGYDCITTLIMSCCICLFFLQLPPLRLNRYIQLIARNTLGIYLTHGIIIYATKPIISSYLVMSNVSCQLIYSAIILIVSLLIVMALKRIPYVRLLVRM